MAGFSLSARGPVGPFPDLPPAGMGGGFCDISDLLALATRIGTWKINRHLTHMFRGGVESIPLPQQLERDGEAMTEEKQ
ncbi:hypothetical protein CHELA20_54402 [Hyphomicrobiales bacterium]|nr:hypothetical protein CHELA41_20526 [Hyphomicrobiales bacterium]CAH1686192.1 hypothetical protein CHELA20_54402 [Hyphomicrobiales bacterium]